jgi:hypothetical protein
MDSLLTSIKALSVDEQDRLIVQVLQSRETPTKKGKKAKKDETTSSESESAPKAKRAPSEKTLAWNAEINRVWEEMKATDPTVKRSAALAEASRRRKAATVSSE